MKAENPLQIFDLYQILPGHGESSIKLTYTPNDLIIEVSYDISENSLGTISFYFENCVSYEVASFPGLSIYNNQRDGQLTLGSLVEYSSSDYANSWNEYLKYLNGNIKHFSILFLGENKQINVFATKATYIVSN